MDSGGVERPRQPTRSSGSLSCGGPVVRSDPRPLAPGCFAPIHPRATLAPHLAQRRRVMTETLARCSLTSARQRAFTGSPRAGLRSGLNRPSHHGVLLASGTSYRSVDGGAGDREQLGRFGGRVLAGAVQLDWELFLVDAELGLPISGPADADRRCIVGANPDRG